LRVDKEIDSREYNVPINISIGNIGNIEITRFANMVTEIRIIKYNDINNPDAESLQTMYVHDDEFDCSEDED
jgi:hypothetical protein